MMYTQCHTLMLKEPKHMEVRGESSFNSKAVLSLRTYSAFTDLTIATLIITLGIHVFKILPFPSFPLMGAGMGTLFLYWALQKTFFGITLGERIWHLKAKGIARNLYQKDYLTWEDRGKS